MTAPVGFPIVLGRGRFVNEAAYMQLREVRFAYQGFSPFSGA